MKIIESIKNFWLDFFSASHRRLMKNNKEETPITNLVYMSLTQAVNFNTIMIIFLLLFFPFIKLNFIILSSPFIVLGISNIYYFYYKLSEKQRENILNRTPKYKVIVYDLYIIFSTILFMLSLYIASKIHNVPPLE